MSYWPCSECGEPTASGGSPCICGKCWRIKRDANLMREAVKQGILDAQKELNLTPDGEAK